MNETTRKIIERALQLAFGQLDHALSKRENLKAVVLKNEDEILRLRREIREMNDTLEEDA